MTEYDKREQAFEAAFAHDEDMRFKALARRDRKLGLWAAGLMGKSGAEAEAYAETLIVASLELPGDSDIASKLAADFAKTGVVQSAHQIRRTMDEMLAISIQENKKAI